MAVAPRSDRGSQLVDRHGAVEERVNGGRLSGATEDRNLAAWRYGVLAILMAVVLREAEDRNT
ncbi:MULTISPECIES: hypothetical protein [unclassified Streptomyces]|uniref:hypothetical protein n=1 Tax=unclassified Streptomyces TaxID=2593676 RepID=UPI0035E39CA4